MLSRTSSRAASSLLRAALQPPTAPFISTAIPALTTTLRSQTPISLSQSQRARSYYRNLHTTPILRKGITPDSADPAPPKTEPAFVAGAAKHIVQPSPLTDEQYREYSEHYFNVLLSEVETAQEENGADLEAEYSAGVLNVTVPDKGVYVLNKQPPNKQIWLSSPISGPKRYDWVVQGDRMDEKEGTREFIHGQWIYLRDGSNLTDLLNKELGLEMGYDLYADVE
ncbi:Mitochondrial chaperone Frataxin [Onygenales sp. PD_40]|nr:Mitochondrial chaperone Frataxin [Onygenales sp. PD_40]KAK2786994.1 Mitochondrial chaperone Frataxin [Onygenales sp. PD_12]